MACFGDLVGYFGSYKAIAILTSERISSEKLVYEATPVREGKSFPLRANEEGGRWDLNPRMVVPQTTALTTWLRPPYILLRHYNTIKMHFNLIV